MHSNTVNVGSELSASTSFTGYCGYGTTQSNVPVLRSNVIVSRSQFSTSRFAQHESSTITYNGNDSHDRISEGPWDTPIPPNTSDLLPLNKSDLTEETISTSSSTNDAKTSKSMTLQQVTCRNSKKFFKTDKKEPHESTFPKKNIAHNFICSICSKGFKHKSYYEYHLRTHSGERPFKCTICPKRFFERSKLNRHMSSCHNVKNSVYEDDDIEPEVNKCPQCGKVFSRSSSLQVHLLTHKGSRPFPCTKCDKKFSGLTALKNHEKSHLGKKSVMCDICGKVFLLKKYLDLHLKTTHKKQKRIHKCSRCRKEFHSNKDLERHQLIHSNERNFTCRLCKTAFKRKDNLHRHLKLTHLLSPKQINSANLISEATNGVLPSVPAAPPLNHQVSVIKSTHEVMMSITRGQL